MGSNFLRRREDQRTQKINFTYARSLSEEACSVLTVHFMRPFSVHEDIEFGDSLCEMEGEVGFNHFLLLCLHLHAPRPVGRASHLLSALTSTVTKCHFFPDFLSQPFPSYFLITWCFEKVTSFRDIKNIPIRGKMLLLCIAAWD